MGKRMHNHTAGHAVLQTGEHELSILYRQKLLEMQRVVAKLYDQYSDTNGLLRYSDLATYNIGNKTITQLRRMLDDAFEMRAKIIRNNLRRGTAEQYHDVLYQVEKHARAAKLNNDILNIDISADGIADFDSLDDAIARSLDSPGKGPDGKDLPTWEETIKKRNAESLNIIKKAFQAPLSEDGITLEQHMKSIQNALSRDAGLMIRVQHTYGNKLVNQGTTAAFESRYAERIRQALKDQNKDLKVVWRHDDPEEPRQNHIDLDGTPADENGEWHTNGYSTKGPGQFGVPSEDINCKCYLSVEVVS